jgi:hypothetical protein
MTPERIAELTRQRDTLAEQVKALRANPPTSRRKPKDGSPPGPPKYWLREVKIIDLLIAQMDRMLAPGGAFEKVEAAPAEPAPDAPRAPLARTGVDIARIPKGKRAEMRVSVSEWKGRRIVDVRLWYIPKAGTEWAPSRKGVSVESGKVDALLSALVLAKQHLLIA